jgi:type IV secretory pathway protease TraF
MGVPPPSDDVPSDRTYHRPRAPRKPILAAGAFIGAAAWAFLRWKPFRVEIAGPSMRPALEPGEWALAVSTPRLRRGAVVVVEHPRRPGFEMVKRLVGVPGDRAPDGRVLGADEFWVEGDATEISTDSRHFGPVGRRDVKAAVRLVYWPLDRRRVL